MAVDVYGLADRISRRYGVPPALTRAVIKQESGGRVNAVSPAGARGPMQLMPATARGLGVDPDDPQQNIQGGVRYLKQQYDSFGNWGDALEAYNAGPGRVVRGSGVVGIPETQNYVKNVLSMYNQNRGSGPQPQPPGGGGGGVMAPPTGGFIDAGKLKSTLDKAGKRALKGQMPSKDYLKTMTELAKSAGAGLQTVAAARQVGGQAAQAAQVRGGAANVVPGGRWEPGSYGYDDPEGQGGRHMAIDIFGTNFVAPEAGVVTRIDPSKGNTGQVYGGVIHIRTPDNRTLVMRHVDPQGVKVGSRVAPGQPLGQTTNWSGGPRHVHFEMYKGPYDYHNGPYMNPYEFYKRRGIKI